MKVQRQYRIPRKERQFLTQGQMRMIRWDVAVRNREIKARGAQDKEYVSLHPFGCGCCFAVTTYVQPAPAPSPKPKSKLEIMAEDTTRYRALMGA